MFIIKKISYARCMEELKLLLLFSSIMEIVPMRIDFIDFTNSASEFSMKIVQQESQIICES